MSRPRRPAVLLATLFALLLIAGGVVAVSVGGGDDDHDKVQAEQVASVCPKGFRTLGAGYLRELREGAGGKDDGDDDADKDADAKKDADSGTEDADVDQDADGGGDDDKAANAGKPAVGEDQDGGPAKGKDGKAVCLNNSVRSPEPFGDVTKANDSATDRFGLDAPHEYANAAIQRDRLAPKAGGVAGTGGTWRTVGNGPLVFDDPQYPDNFGLSRAAGRVSDYSYDPAGKRLFASVANGGVWSSADRGAHWTSVGDTLPTQIVGAVTFTSAGGGTLVALTGDNAFGGNTYGGLGIFWSNDLGKSWHKATDTAGNPGFVDGAQGFRVVSRPDQPATMYAATGYGLYRSLDAGRTWTNVVLPTGACAGKSTTKKGCFLANIVTDVQVEGGGGAGTAQPGAVVAAVGWRAGPKKNADGSVQAPSNGIYTSATGAAGSFTKTADSSFLSGPDVGRVALGGAYGAKQDHNYVYALVQNSKLFDTGKLEGLDTPSGDPLGLGVDPTKTATYVEGVFVSADFGKTWKELVSRDQLLSPTTGSTLSQLQGLGFGPGIQAWYNEWVRPEPTQQSALGGVPTRLSFGLEEVYETTLASGLDGTTPANPTAVGPYAVAGGECILTLTGGACGQVSQATGATTIHPDQHAAAYVPDADGGSTLFAGSDGGAYSQKTPTVGLMTSSGFGKGIDQGFNTLLPYGLGVAKDGTIFAGLQDNGTEKIDPKTGTQYETLGGDGTFALVDPDDSKQALAATPNGGLDVTHTGGVKEGSTPATTAYTDVAPTGLTGAQFLTPFVFDDVSTARIGLAGRNIFIANTKIADLTASSWQQVYDLGTAKHPGVAAADATQTAGDINNVSTAMALRNNVAYVGYCGSCDPVVNNIRFKNGIATDVGGKWHLAKAAGLSEKLINNIQIDPTDPKTIYVALGESTARPYAPANALGDDGVSTTGGHVYKSTDGGESFTDISGDLPNIGATWLLVRGDQLLAATTVGVFASTDKNGTSWGELGTNLPTSPVFSMVIDPADPNQLVAASYGRGIYRYTFAAPTGGTTGPGGGTGTSGPAGGGGTDTTPGATPPAGTDTTPGTGTPGGTATTPGTGAPGSETPGGQTGVPAGCKDVIAPMSKYKTRKLKVRGRRLVLSGTASDRGCAHLAKIFVSISRATGNKCRYLQTNGRLRTARESCLRTRYIPAKGTTHWSFTSPKTLPAGNYKIWVRAVDSAKNTERKKFSRNGLKVTIR